MQLDWIDDILAVIDTGSLAQAAERRFLTQSAFTRRVRTIEEKLGTRLFDRSRKPVVALPGVRALEPELREMSARLRRLQLNLRVSDSQAGAAFTLVCQHAITATISPWVVRELTARGEASVRVRSGNRDECLMMVLSGEVEFAMAYEAPDERRQTLVRGLEAQALGADLLVPVAAPELAAQEFTGPKRTGTNGHLPFIGYPPDVFLGRVFGQYIVPRLAETTVLSLKAETALTLAACEYVLSGIGVAWLPLTLVARHLAAGRLVRLEGLPEQELNITLTRLAGGQHAHHDALWRDLAAHPDFPGGLPG